MQYTPDQLVALVEEARGHVHEVMMGAIWDEARYKRCQDFMERTNIVEYQTNAGKTLVQFVKPFPKVFEELDAKVHAKSVDEVTQDLVETQPMPADTMEKAFKAAKKLDEVAAKRPRGRPRLHPTEPVPPGLSIDQEVAFMRKHGVIGSRDALREIVKTRRHLQAG